MSSSTTARSPIEILADADRAADGASCDASTDCCRFAVTGREPSITQAEWRLVVAELRRQGRRLPTIPDDDDERCPLLSPSGRCIVYAARPLGCRTFFCERARAADGGEVALDRRAMNALAQELEALGGGKGRPLRSWLRAAQRG